LVYKPHEEPDLGGTQAFQILLFMDEEIEPNNCTSYIDLLGRILSIRCEPPNNDILNLIVNVNIGNKRPKLDELGKVLQAERVQGL
jgi:hypothetical protein